MERRAGDRRAVQAPVAAERRQDDGGFAECQNRAGLHIDRAVIELVIFGLGQLDLDGGREALRDLTVLRPANDLRSVNLAANSSALRTVREGHHRGQRNHYPEAPMPPDRSLTGGLNQPPCAALVCFPRNHSTTRLR